jgi:predicted phosphodiesterase
MKAQLLSDVHTCFYHDPIRLLASLEFASGLDFLLLPGDIVVPAVQGLEKTKEVLGFLSKKARHVLFVEGNHEFYRNTFIGTRSSILKSLPSNFHHLRNTDETIEGQHFFGGTMWFPDAPHNRMYEDQLSDFLVIQGFRGWVYRENQAFRDMARRLVTSRTIVLSHHVPSYQAVHPMFQGDSLNRFFVSEMADIILDRNPPLWVYGHTHLPHDCMVGGTRLVANPFGYPSERSDPSSYAPVILETP